MNLKSILSATVVAVGLAVAAPASATLTLQSGLVGGSGDVDNVIFNACGLGGSTGTTVQGCLNTNHSTLVNFTGNETLVIGEGGGQAVITAQNGTFDNISVTLANQLLGFDKLQFNLDAEANGTADFRAVDQFGNVFNFTNVALSGNGSNFFTLGSIDGQVAVSFTLVSTVGIQNITDLAQVRLGTANVTTVPEPMSLALFGAGLLGLGMVRRKPIV